MSFDDKLGPTSDFDIFAELCENLLLDSLSSVGSLLD